MVAYGIEKGLKLESQPIVGNGYEDKDNVRLADNLGQATEIMRSSEKVRSVFGDEFVDHFAATRDWERRQHLAAITDWKTLAGCFANSNENTPRKHLVSLTAR